MAFNHQSQWVQIAGYKANMVITVCMMSTSAIMAIIGCGSVSGVIETHGVVVAIPLAILVTSTRVSLFYPVQAAMP